MPTETNSALAARFKTIGVYLISQAYTIKNIGAEEGQEKQIDAIENILGAVVVNEILATVDNDNEDTSYKAFKASRTPTENTAEDEEEILARTLGDHPLAFGFVPPLNVAKVDLTENLPTNSLKI